MLSCNSFKCKSKNFAPGVKHILQTVHIFQFIFKNRNKCPEKSFQWMMIGEFIAKKAKHFGLDSSYLSHISLIHL